MPRRAAKVDANQAQIVSALRAAGCSVLLLHRVGEGCPDTLVAYHGRMCLMEIKDGSKPPSARKLTKAQEKFHAEWNGPIAVVKDIKEAYAAIGISPIAKGWRKE